jgi:tetratricopeptide (TPR) repeat protein
VVPLARLVTARALSGPEAERARRHAHALLAAADPGWPDDQPGSAQLYREIAEHVDATGLVESGETRAREAVLHQIRFRYLMGEQNAACDLGERAYNLWRAGNDPAQDDHLVLRTSQAWANALRANGRYEKAGELTRSAMSQLRVDVNYGENHPHTLGMASSRAADLRISGDYERAREFDEETLERCETRFGADHPRTIMSRHNLGISLRLTGDFESAETSDRTALRQHRDMFGPDNWRTLLSVNALAEDLNGQGRYQDVLHDLEPLMDRVGARRRTWMDRGLMLAGRALALARRGVGRLTEALALLESANAECADLLGERHDYTLALRMSQANTLHLLGRTDEAAAQAAQAFDLYRRQFGARNPLTVAAEINLANMLRAAGDHARAMRIDGASSEALLDKVGLNHPFSVAAAVNLASDYAQSGHPNRLAASRRAVELAKRVHTRLDHPDVLVAEANLTVDLVAVNGPAAVTMRQKVLQRLERQYGSDHPTAATVARGERVDCVLEPPLP